MPEPSILDVMQSLPAFRGPSWGAWRVLLAALFSLPMSAADRQVFQRLTGRSTPPASPAREAWWLFGRRAGKSLVAALVAIFVACFRAYRLAPGELGVVILICPDRRQAQVLLRYVLALLDSVPTLARLITRRTQDAVYLSNGVVIEIKTASFRTLRGYTVLAVIIDEVCFLRDDTSANPDVEIINAVRPAMATIRNGLLLCLSSPHARRGAAWDAYRQHFGQDASPVLVANADTATMNATVDPQIIADAYARDPAVAAAEYGGQFRTDVETYVAFEIVELGILDGPLVRPPEPERHYTAFVDPSGGSQDSMTLGIAHTEDWNGAPLAVLDLVDEVTPPFSPAEVVARFAEQLRAYRVAMVTGDRYAGEWPREGFRAHGIRYEPSTKTKTDLYRDLLPLLNSGRVGIPDHPVLICQLVGLERRTIRGGGETIDRPRGHDDVSNAAAGALTLAMAGAQRAPSFVL